MGHDDPQAAADAGQHAASPPGEVRLAESHAVVPTPDGIRAARSFVRATLAAWAVELPVLNAVLDVAHELVSNAVQHGAAPIVLQIELGRSGIDIVVSDASPATARRLPYRPGVSERGLGLRLVAQLSRDWGQRAEPPGKAVWAVVDSRLGR